MNALTPFDYFLAEILVKGVLLLAAAFAVAYALRHASAAVRHGLWSLAFLGLLLLPVGGALLPSWQAPLPIPLKPAAAPARALAAAPPSALPEAAAADPARPAAPLAAVAPAPPPAASAWFTWPLVPGAWSWASVLMAVWAAGAVALLGRLALVVRELSLLRRRATPVTDAEWNELTEVLADVLAIRRPIQLLQHDEVAVPLTFGVWQPVVLLPAEAEAWDTDRKHVTLSHELLHVRRYDYLVHLVALCARALHWCNPIAWMATRRLLMEREQACDDGVLALGVASTSYADHLLAMAREVLGGRPVPATGAVAVANPSELRSRIVAILDPERRRHTLSRLRAVGMATAALLLVLPLAAMRPDDGRGPIQHAGAPADMLALEPSERTPAPDAVTLGAQLALVQQAPQAAEAVRAVASVAEATSAVAHREQAADTTSVKMQKQAVYAIAQLPPDQSVPLLTEIARTHANMEVRETAIFWLGEEGGADVSDLLVELAMNDPASKIRKQAIFALSQLSDEVGIAPLVNIARTHGDPDLRADAVFWIGQAGGTEAAEVLESFAWDDPQTEVQEKAIFAISELPSEVGVPRLIRLAQEHPNEEMRNQAIFWLGETGDPRAADVLMGIINGP